MLASYWNFVFLCILKVPSQINSVAMFFPKEWKIKSKEKSPSFVFSSLTIPHTDMLITEYDISKITSQIQF